MMVGDRVRLTDRAAATMAKNTHRSNTDKRHDWYLRRGTVEKITAHGRHCGIKWDDRTSLDWFPEYALQLIEQPLPNPPASTPETAGVPGWYGPGKAASPFDPSPPGRARRPPIRMKRLKRGARDVL